MSADPGQSASFSLAGQLRWTLVLCITGMMFTGCSGYTGPRSVVNEDPAVKIPEIRKAVDAGDRSVMPQLVSDLDNDDAAVRLYAIGALERLTGETFGYEWTQADRATRRPSIERWQAYLQASQGDAARGGK